MFMIKGLTLSSACQCVWHVQVNPSKEADYFHQNAAKAETVFVTIGIILSLECLHEFSCIVGNLSGPVIC